MTEPLVILPGFMADARGFLPQLVGLGQDRPVTVLMPTGADTVEQISQGVMQGLPDRFALLGHGLGGDVAVDLLRRLPERVSRIALVATDPLPEMPALAAQREARLVLARTGRLETALEADLPPHALAETPWRDDIRLLMAEMALGLGLEVYLRQTRAMQRRPDQQKTLRRVKVPALILSGRADPLLPLRRAEFMATLMPYGQLQVIEDAGHHPQLEQPEAVNAALAAFLAGPMLLR